MKIGLQKTVSTIVNDTNTAAAVASGAVNVFATPMMIALMEKAAFQLVQELLPDGDSTVGTLVNTSHLKASPLGEKVEAIATLTEIDGRRLVFEIDAYDSKGLIGKCIHERFIINVDKFLSKL